MIQVTNREYIKKDDLYKITIQKDNIKSSFYIRNMEDEWPLINSLW